MKKIITILTLLCWQCGYAHNICEVKRIENISRAVAWELSTSTTDSCLTVLMPKNIKVKQRYLQQIKSAYASDVGQRTKYIAVFPEVVNKNGKGIYGIRVKYEDGSGMYGCALYDGKRLIFPFVPQTNSYDMSEDIYQVRIEVVEVFLKKYKNFTEQQKKEVTRIFTKGNFLPPPEGRYL